MALPASGAISLSAVNTELGLSATAAITMNDAAVRSLFGKSSGAITMNDGYGKSNSAAFIASGWQYPVYSMNGTTWTQTNWPSGLGSTAGSPAGSNGPYQWQETCYYGNGRFMAATTGSFPTTKLAYSIDGITWTESGTSPISAAYNCGAGGGGVYVFLSSQGGTNMIYSTDGTSWTSSNALANTGVSWSAMKYANGVFLATGSNVKIGRSTDGINWSVITHSRLRQGGGYGNGMWIQASASQNNGRAYYYTSTDNGVNWTERTGPYQLDRNGFEAPGGFNDFMYGGGKWVAWTSQYSSAYSTDGINWTTFMLPAGNYYKGAYSERLGLFVLVGPAGASSTRCVTSPNGIDWTVRTIPTTVMNGAGPYGVAAS